MKIKVLRNSFEKQIQNPDGSILIKVLTQDCLSWLCNHPSSLPLLQFLCSPPSSLPLIQSMNFIWMNCIFYSSCAAIQTHCISYSPCLIIHLQCLSYTPSPYPGMKPNVGELWDIYYWGPIVNISKFMSMCDKSCHTAIQAIQSYRPWLWNGTDQLILGHRKFWLVWTKTICPWIKFLSCNHWY